MLLWDIMYNHQFDLVLMVDHKANLSAAFVDQNDSIVQNIGIGSLSVLLRKSHKESKHFI